MKKKAMLFLAILLIPLALADFNLDIQKVDKGSVVISELNNPAVFDFVIDNLGDPDNFEIYSPVGVSMAPKGTFDLPKGISTIEVSAYPNAEIRKRPGFFIFEYELRGQDTGILKDKLQIKIVELKEVVEIRVENVRLGDKTANVYIINKENTNLNDLRITGKSVFFDFDKKVSIGPYQNVSFEVDLKDLEKVVAGPYVLSSDVVLSNIKVEIDGVINYLEKEGLSVKTDTTGLIVRITKTEKKNEGNVPVSAKIEMRKNIVSRLFTSLSSEPSSSVRHGFFVNYVWDKNANPGETFSVSMITNYTLPFIFVILVVVVAFLAKVYSQTNLVLTKRVNFVKTKGGEFALKVRLHVKARKHVDKVQLIDRLPGMTKLYEEYGIKPDRIEESTRRLFWNIDRMSAGEERVFSYVIYSKLNVIGRFELPAATGIYEFNGKTFEVWSNRAFFASETDKTED